MKLEKKKVGVMEFLRVCVNMNVEVELDEEMKKNIGNLENSEAEEVGNTATLLMKALKKKGKIGGEKRGGVGIYEMTEEIGKEKEEKEKEREEKEKEKSEKEKEKERADRENREKEAEKEATTKALQEKEKLRETIEQLKERSSNFLSSLLRSDKPSDTVIDHLTVKKNKNSYTTIYVDKELSTV
jgi:outer membrane biosynthesis protein TonB